MGRNATESRVVCTIDGGVAEVVLNRPEKRNALDPAMFDALIAAGDRLRNAPGVRAVVIAGNGRAFCAGLDFGSFDAMAASDAVDVDALLGPPPATTGAARARGQQAAYVWSELEVPVIAAVHGVAYGGGLQVALGADIRIVAPDAQLSVREIAWGLVPDMTGTQLLPELVGRDRAKELTFTGRVVDGVEAAAMGLATSVADHPLGAARALAADIAARSPEAIRHAKSLLDMAGRVPLVDGFQAEQVAVRELIGSPNQIEAVRAAMSGRAPQFYDVGATMR